MIYRKIAAISFDYGYIFATVKKTVAFIKRLYLGFVVNSTS